MAAPKKVKTGYEDKPANPRVPDLEEDFNSEYEDDILDRDPEDEEETRTTKRRGSTPFDLLREALQVEVDDKHKTYPVPKRPGVSVQFNTAIDADRVDIWRKRSEKGKGRNREFDGMKFSLIVIANQCTGFFINGEEVLDGDGEPVTFRSPVIREFLRLPDIASFDLIIKKLYVADGHVISVADRIIEEAGFGEDVPEDDENPTT